MFVAIAMSLHERVLHVGGLALQWRIGGTNADRSAPPGRAWSAAALSAIYENGSAVKARLLCSAPPAGRPLRRRRRDVDGDVGDALLAAPGRIALQAPVNPRVEVVADDPAPVRSPEGE